MLTAAYQKILYLPRPLSKRYPMAVERRAKQFAPFAALKGFEESVKEKEIIYEPKKFLPDEKKNELDMKLKLLKPGMNIRAVYYQESRMYPGTGQHRTAEGIVDFYDPMIHLRIGDAEIKIQDLYDLSGDCFEMLETPC